MVRRAAVAGLFYPAEPERLREVVAACMGGPCSDEPAVAVVAPHAGYVYSGRVAGAVFRSVRVPDRAVVLAPNHTGLGLGVAALWPGTAFETPWGPVAVDRELADAIAARCPWARPEPAAHLREHAVEVLLPFLQFRAPGVRIVPIVVGFEDREAVRALGAALADAVRAEAPDALLVASSDMNHYEPAAVGRRKDELALEAIRRLDAEGLLEVTERFGISMCGRAPAAAALVAARALGARSTEVVDYGHSGEVTGEDTSVVGYAGVVIR